MEKIENIEKYIPYRQLMLKRDLNKMVLELYAFGQIMIANNSTHIRGKSCYREYMLKYGNLYERVKELLNRAKVLGMNPNNLGVHEEDLKEKLLKIYEYATESEKEKLDNLSQEIRLIRRTLFISAVSGMDKPEPEYFSTELIHLYEEGNLPFSDDQFGEILKALCDGYVEHRVNSSEYDFILEADGKQQWCDSCFKSYFIDRKLSLEERQLDFERIFDAGYTELNDRMLENFKKYLDFYLSNGCQLTEIQFTSFIEDEKFSDEEIEILANHKDAFPFDICEYIDRLLEEKMGGSRLEHDIESPFYKNRLESSEEVKAFERALVTIIPKLLKLRGEDFSEEDIIGYLAKRIVSLDGSGEIADFISNVLHVQSLAAETVGDLEAYYETLKNAFDRGYVSAIEQSRKENGQMQMAPVNPNKIN